MVKSLAALAILSLLAFSALVLPSFAPPVQASEAAVLLKADRLPAWVAKANCSTQVWPDFTASCLRNTGSGSVREARVVAR
jgi:hypothetical protein